MLTKIDRTTIDGLERRYRAQLINSLPGFKSVNLCSTLSAEEVSNLSVIHSVIHVGANPPLMGMLFRPLVVPRHTLTNILSKGFFTLNHLNQQILEKGHQTSAKYNADQSEFAEVGLTEEYLDNFPVPFVKESNIKIGLRFEQRMDIELNGTVFIIGAIEVIWLPENTIVEDGFVDLERAGSITSSGLDAYYKPEKLARFAYAKPGQTVEQLKGFKH